MIVIVALIVFWLSVGLMFHSYVWYLILLSFFSKGKRHNSDVYSQTDLQLPEVFILMSVHNEEKVILKKLEGLTQLNYPTHRLSVYIGSDNSTDNTNQIVERFSTRFSGLSFTPFYTRQGKANVINLLAEQALQKATDKANAIFVSTDANVFFEPDTVYQMVKHFRNPDIGVVAATVNNTKVEEEGISLQEKSYISRETQMKYLEGLNWGTMMGAFGACYAMRAGLFKPVPAHFIVDDFYLTMQVLLQNKKAISEPLARCYEDLPAEIEVEFNRKARIQSGNFQNLAVFWPVLFRFNALAFCFLSHKVLRWLGPLFIILAYVANLCLLPLGHFYLFTWVVQNLLLLTPVIDKLFKKMGLHLVVLRFAAYFYTMNFALTIGFFRYVKGIETSVWTSTKRSV